MATVTSLCEETGVSYRQANHWISKGYIPDVVSIGSGFPLSLNGKQSEIFRIMADLVHAGFKPDTAAKHAAEYYDMGSCHIRQSKVMISIERVSDQQRENNL